MPRQKNRWLVLRIEDQEYQSNAVNNNYRPRHDDALRPFPTRSMITQVIRLFVMEIGGIAASGYVEQIIGT
jgi:hypothetical protein